jgi:hypothetical protein
MKTGTEALSSRLLAEPLPPTLVIPIGEDWPQSRSDVAKHPELGLLGTRRGAPIERRLADIVTAVRQRDIPDVTILLVAEALSVAKYPNYIIKRLTELADSLEVVMFSRHQGPALHSLVAHRIQSWTSPNHLRPEHSLVLRAMRQRFHYDEFLERWSGEGHRLIVIPYFEDDRKTDGLMTRFTKQTGIRIPEAGKSKLKNSSLGKTQLQRLGDFKAKWAWARSVPLVRDLARLAFFSLRKNVQGEPPSARWVPTRAENRTVVDFYRDSNARFKKLLGAAARRPEWKRWFSEIE